MSLSLTAFQGLICSRSQSQTRKPSLPKTKTKQPLPESNSQSCSAESRFRCGLWPTTHRLLNWKLTRSGTEEVSMESLLCDPMSPPTLSSCLPRLSSKVPTEIISRKQNQLRLSFVTLWFIYRVPAGLRGPRSGGNRSLVGKAEEAIGAKALSSQEPQGLGRVKANIRCVTSQ